MSHSKRIHVGFTLIELVLALALGALLMTALVGVLRGATLQLKIAENQTQQRWQSSTLEQLQADLFLAARIRWSDGCLWLEGEFNEFDNAGSKARQLRYLCVPWIDGRTALIRISDHATELITVGPRRILFERLDNTNAPQPLSPTYTPMPERVRVWIWTEDAVTPELQRDVVLR